MTYRFKYLFEKPEGRVHPPILDLQPLLNDGTIINVDGPGGTIKAEFLSVSHGPTPSGGFLFNDQIAYTPDVWGVEDDVLEKLNGIDVWVLDALRYNEHPTHAHADRAMQWLANTAVKKGVLTNLHIDMDYQVLSKELSGEHIAAFDGLELYL